MKILTVLLLAGTGLGYVAPGPVGPGMLAPARHWCDAPAFAESTHSYDVRHYRADFDLPMTDASFTCHERICLASRVPALDTFSLHFDSLVCDSVKRNGTPLAFATPAGLLSVTLDTPLARDDSTTVEVFYHRNAGTPNQGYFYGQPPSCRYAHAMTCGCPMDNRFWLPSWDLPFDKPERGIEFNLTVPDTFQTCSNGLCDSVTSNADGTLTYWWRHPYPIATYLMTFSASRFVSWQQQFVNPNGDTIPMPYYVWPEDSATSVGGFANVPLMMEFFADTMLYGAYPFEKYGTVPGYYGFPWGGMEHQTIMMIHRSYISGGHDRTLAHELSHMWWGDMVTQVDFRHVWLNEGFATYSECLYMGHASGIGTFRSLMTSKAYTFFAQDRTNRFPVFDPPDIYNLGTSYCKGAWVQHMLRWVVGDTAWEQPGTFFEGMRAYGDSFRYGTPSTDDYCRVMERHTGLELEWFFDEWIYQAGFPRYFMDWSSEPVGDSFRVITTLAQDNGAQAPGFFRTPLPVMFSCLYVDTLVAIRPEANPQVDTFMLGSCPEELTVDPDNWVLDSCYLTGIAEAGPAGSQSPGALLGPNPARGRVRFSLPGPGGGTVEVIDRTGRTVRTIVAATGSRNLTWELDDQAGRRLPAGVYFVRFPAAAAVRKLVISE